MSEDRLNRAYELIKSEREDEAISMLEEIIRADRDNGDAWWLYANAVADLDARRNALNNVLRIGANPTREEKARAMLAALNSDDPFDLPIGSPAEPAATRPARKSRIALGIVAVFSACACITCFMLFSAAGKMVYAPDSYDYQGTVMNGDVKSGVVTTAGDWDGYLYEGHTGETLIVSAHPGGESIAPFVFLFGSDDLFIAVSNETSPSYNRLRARLPEDGTYLILVRTFFGFGAGEYDLTVSVEGL